MRKVREHRAGGQGFEHERASGQGFETLGCRCGSARKVGKGSEKSGGEALELRTLCTGRFFRTLMCKIGNPHFRTLVVSRNLFSNPSMSLRFFDVIFVVWVVFEVKGS